MGSQYAVLSSEEWDVLANFGLKKFNQNVPFSMDSNTLLDDVLCLDVLQEIMPEIGAPNLKITASLVMKRIAFLVLAPVLYSMSRFDKGLDAALDNCVFEYRLENRMWQSKMPLKNITVICWEKSRNDWRTQILTKVFSGHLTQLVEQFHTLTKVPKRVLWENIAVRVFSIYENRILKDIPEDLKPQAQEDYAFILGRKNTALFGGNENPLSDFLREKQKTILSNDKVRVRRTCCYYYLATEPPVYCSTCPLPLKRAKKDTLIELKCLSGKQY